VSCDLKGNEMAVEVKVPTVQIDKNESAPRQDKMEKYVLFRELLRRLPYNFGSSLFSLSLQNPLARKVLKRIIGPLRRLTRELGMTPISPLQFDRFIQTNYLSNWRLHGLTVCNKHFFNKFVEFKNLDYFELYYGQRGIILNNSHTGGGKLVVPLISRLGYNLSSLDRVDSYTHISEPGRGAIESILLGTRKDKKFHLKEMFKCQKRLAKKGVLHIVSDGYRGNSGYETSFLGRRRTFRRSFAELAVSSNAVVIPVRSRVEPCGKVLVEFLSPIDPGKLPETDESKIQGLCESYARMLEQDWQIYPDCVFKNDIKLFFELESSAAQSASRESE